MTEGSSQGIGGENGKGGRQTLRWVESTGLGNGSEGMARKREGRGWAANIMRRYVEAVMLTHMVSQESRHPWDMQVESQVDSWRV